MGRTWRAAHAYLATVLGLGVLVAVALPPATARLAATTLIAALSALAVVAGVRRNRPSSPRSWYLLAGGLLLFALSGALGGVTVFDVARPSPADAATFLAFVLLLSGVLGLLGERVVGNRRAVLLDSLLGASACSMLAWIYLVRPTTELNDSSIGLVLTASAYAVASVVLMAVAVPLWSAVVRPVDTSARMLVLAMLVLAATNVAYGFAVLAGVAPSHGVGDSILAGWLAFFLLVGLAALHPGCGIRPPRPPDDVEPPSWKRFALLIVVAALAPIALVVGDAAQGRELEVWPLVIGTVSMVTVVIVRMGDIQSDLRGALARERTLRTANDELVATMAVDDVRDVLVRATRSLIEQTADDVWLVEDPRIAGFRPEDANDGHGDGPVHVVTGSSDLRSILCVDDATVLVVAELPTSTSTRLAVVVGSKRRPRLEVLIALDALVQCAALAIDRVELGQQVLAKHSEARLQRLLQDASDVVVVLDRRLVIRYVTPAVERMLGRHPLDLTRSRILELVHEDDRDTAETMIRSSSEGWPTRGELRLCARDGSVRHVELAVSRVAETDGGGFTFACHDITVRHDLEERLTHQAFHDALTGLANRALFQDRLRHAIERTRRTGDRFALLFIDVDDFKSVNDSLGHAAGDTLLRTVADRLVDGLRAQDTSARLGGDEFAVIIEDAHDPRGLDDTLNRLIEHLSHPVRIGASDVHIGVSIGVTYGGSTDDEPDELMRNADLALYEAKGAGKGRYAVFEPTMHTSAVDHLQLKSDLRRALNQDEIGVQFQPMFRLDGSRTVVGVEALVRWQHPTRGALAPAQFIDLAEQTGLVVPLGRVVLDRALDAAAAWHRLPDRADLTVAVNVSARQLSDPTLIDDVRSALERTGIDPGTVILEITESTLLPDQGVARQRLDELVALGVRLYVDDFGTGHSSLAYLRDLPVSGIKLARSFVEVLPGRAGQSALVRTIHDLAVRLGLDDVVAEGIENAAQLDELVALGYTVGQGYHLARPTDADGITALLTAVGDGEPALPGVRG